MSQRNSNARTGFSFMQMVVGVMALLKVKEKYDEYRQVSDEEEEGRVALTSPLPDNLANSASAEGRIALLETEVPETHATRQKKKKACCMCCGYDCSLLWKAIGVVLGLYTLYYGFKAIKWAMTDAPTGLEGMPAFDESLGCSDASFLYNDTVITTTAPIGSTYHDHKFDTHGAGVGTITLFDGEADATEVKYEITVKTNSKDILNDVFLTYPPVNDDGTITKSLFVLGTSQAPASNDKVCMKYDVKIYVPPTLKKLFVASHTPAQLQIAPGAKINVESLYITLFSMDELNMILPNKDIQAKQLRMEVYRGWIVGEAPVFEETDISTQRGDGVVNLKLHIALPEDAEHPKKVGIMSETGAGRTDITVIGNKGFKRRISSTHLSSRNADMYLTYRDAEFDGKIAMDSKSYTVTGAKSFAFHPPQAPEPRADDKWTHYVGSREGKDDMFINSRGWTGLYF